MPRVLLALAWSCLPSLAAAADLVDLTRATIVARADPNRRIFANRTSSWLSEGPNTLPGSTMFTVMFCALPANGRPNVELAAKYALVAVKFADMSGTGAGSLW